RQDRTRNELTEARLSDRTLRPDSQLLALRSRGEMSGTMIARLIIGATLALTAAPMLAQDATVGAAPYCADLKRVASLVSARHRFASIAGKPREGQFSDTILPLAGWQDCSLYGEGMYSCDLTALKDANEAEKEQARIVDQVLSCFAGTWLELKDRSSPRYVVL